ncbi:MAG: hypothetical protein OER88_05755 [Planctomycetota bacterium]|nr:hypothetical protein [Planctomycetota bacterium]
MRNPLPPEFFACLAGLVVGSALTMYLAYRMLSHAGARARLRKAWSDETASAVVEFPGALLVLIVLVTVTSQVAFLTTGYLVVDYAAFAAARSASVVIATTEDGEAQGTISDGAKKVGNVKDAAILACYPISGDYTDEDSLTVNLDPVRAKVGQLDNALGSVFDFEFLEAGIGTTQAYLDALGAEGRELASNATALTRYAYAYYNTEVRLVDGSGNAKYGAYDHNAPVTVEVTHHFNLSIPYAKRIFGTFHFPEGYRSAIRASATILNEGATGKAPPKRQRY